MRYVVVTGSNGFIGTNIMDKFLKLDLTHDLGLPKGKLPRFSDESYEESNNLLDIVAVDLTSSLTRKVSQRFAGSSRVKFVPHNELIQFLKTQKNPPIAVIHNGACSSTTETNWEIFQELNLGYTQNLWNYCAEQNVPFIYASSASVYGNGEFGFSDAKPENSKFTPLNKYGKSKHDFDIWALQQDKKPPFWFGLRYFNVYGPFESHKEGQASMAFHGFNQVVKTGKVRLFKSLHPDYVDGGQKRDFIYVKDIVGITVELLKKIFESQNGGEAFQVENNGCFINLGFGTARTPIGIL